MLFQKEIQHVVLAAKYSAHGLRTTWHDEMAFRILATISLVLIPCAFFVGVTAIEKILLISSLLLILIVELLNTAVENAVDLACDLQKNILAGKAKDQGSTATGLACMNATVVWLIILIW